MAEQPLGHSAIRLYTLFEESLSRSGQPLLPADLASTAL